MRKMVEISEDNEDRLLKMIGRIDKKNCLLLSILYKSIDDNNKTYWLKHNESIITPTGKVSDYGISVTQGLKGVLDHEKADVFIQDRKYYGLSNKREPQFSNA